MIKVRVILKCGNEFVIECEKVTVRYSTATGELTSFIYDGCTKNIPLYLNMSQVAAVVQEESANG